MIFDPPVFRVIVVKETHTHTSPVTYQDETKITYYAQALEWDIGGSGKTVEEALTNVELLIYSQQYLYDNKKDTARIGPAPEEWQRVRNIGKEMIHVRKDYILFIGADRHPIVCRKDIDMRNTQFKDIAT